MYADGDLVELCLAVIERGHCFVSVMLKIMMLTVVLTGTEGS